MKSRSSSLLKSPLFENALDAIRCGIEDYKVGTDARRKAAVRNVHAGLLLLFKEKLSRLSDVGSEDALIKRDLVPIQKNGKIVWTGAGNKTVDNETLRKRMSSLGISADFKRLEDVTRIRNQVEHHYTTANPQTINEAITKSFALICTFLRKELTTDPKKRIGAELWSSFVKIQEVYQTEKDACRDSHTNFKSESPALDSQIDMLVCSACDSDLVQIKQDGRSICRACGQVHTKKNTIKHLVACAYDGRNFEAAKENCEPYTRECPVCDAPTFIVEDLICALCGESASGTCQICSNSFQVDEIGESTCFSCQYRMSKDD